MPFTFKLAHRLAQIRRVALMLPVAAVFACVAGDQSINDPAQPSSLITISAAPAASVELLRDDFEDAGFGSRGWYDFASTPTLTDTTHVAGSTRALEVRFAAGATNPSWGLTRRLFPSSPTVYVSYWVRYSANWVGSRQLYHPHEFQVLSDLDGDYTALANSWMSAYIEHNYQNGGIPRLSLQDSRAINMSYGSLPRNLISITENRSIGGCNGLSETYVVASCFSLPPWYNDKEITAPQVWFKPSPGPGYKGNWNHIEAYFQINSIVGGIGVPDGVAQYWFNGTPVIDRHDVMFRTGARPTIKFHQFVMAPYIGDGSPVDQTMWIDNLVVATAPPAAAPAPVPASVATVTVSPAPASVSVGQTVQLTATPRDSSGSALTGRSVTWMSSQTSVATVSVSGLVSGVASGTATITATSEGQSGSAAVTATTLASASVASVTVSPAAPSVQVGQSVQLAATPKDSNGNALSGRVVTWTTSAAAVATVNGSGLVTAVAAGSTTITATSEGQSATAAATVVAGPVTKPGQVTDLRVTGVTDSSMTLAFTEVNDGTGQPARYDVRYAAGTISWSSAPSVSKGTCATPMAGTAIGARRTCTVVGFAPATAFQLQLVAFRGTMNLNAVYGARSNVASGTTTAKGVSVTNPGQVTDLAVTAVTDSSMTLAFTEVTDGTGKPARYDVRYAEGTIVWTSAASVSKGTCATPMAGTAIGARRTCTVIGFAPATAFQLQLIAFRGTMNLNAVYGARSNVASATTTAAVAPPPPPPSLPPPSGSNEPTGFTTIVDRSFDAVSELGWGASSLFNVVTDLTAPRSAPLVGQITFPAGFGGGYEPAATWKEDVDARGFTRMYLSFWVKLSSNWQGHASGVNKIGFVWMHNAPVVYFSEQGSGSGNLEAQIRLQNTPAPARNLTPNLAAVSLTRGQWHRWEVVLVANTGDQANGEAHWWVDGVKVGAYTDVIYGSSTQPKAWGGPEISWMPIWGGIGDTVAQTMYMWMDHMYISGKTF